MSSVREAEAQGKKVLEQMVVDLLKSRPDLTIDQIEETVGCSWNFINRVRKEHNIPNRQRGRWKKQVQSCE